VSLEAKISHALADPSRRIGRFVIVDELGRGGMGVVYRGFDPTVRRLVAIKVLRPDVLPGGGSEDATGVVRFQREVQTVGRLRHPAIVSLLDAGSHEGKPYLVMDFVEGEDLSVLWGRSQMTPRQSAVVVRQVAEAVAYAHEEGILHRDLKPENVLLDSEGRAYLLDFGLARDLDEVDRLTKTGVVVGTPYFLAPELLSRSSRGTSEQTDVYGLGGLLYFCLVGIPPFEGDSVVELLGRVAGGDPKPPREIDPQVHIDLETIALRCLAVDPQDRYFSAEEVVAELKRFLAGEAIEARPPTAWERLSRWASRHRALALTLALFGLSVAGLLAAGVVGAGYSVRQISHEREVAQRERQEAVRAKEAAEEAHGVAQREGQRARDAGEEAEVAAERARAARGVAEKEAERARQAAEQAARAQKRIAFEGLAKDRLLAEALLEQGRLLESERQYGEAAALFARSLELAEAPEARSGVVRLLPRLSSTSWASPRLRFFAVAWHPSGASLALASSGGSVFLVDKTGTKILQRLDAHESWVTCLAFGAPGELITAGDMGVVRRWDLVKGRRDVIGVHEGAVCALAARSDGLVASGALDGVIRLGAPKEKSRVFARHAGPVLGLAFAGRQRLASCGSDGTLRLWNLETGASLHVVQAHRGAATAVAYSPQAGGRLVTGGADQEVRLWDTELNPGSVLVQREGAVSSLCFGPQAKRLAWSTYRGSVRVRDLDAGRDAAAIVEHEGPVHAVAFSPDGASLATASEDCTARVFDALNGERQASFAGQSGFLHMAINDEGVVTLVDSQNRLARWRVKGGRLPGPELKTEFQQVRLLDRSGRWLAGHPSTGRYSLYDLATGHASPMALNEYVSALHESGTALLDLPGNQQPVLRTSGGKRRPLPFEGVSQASFDREGWLVVEDNRAQVFLVDPRGKSERLFAFPSKTSTRHLVLSHRQGRLLRATSGGLEFWDLASRRRVRKVEGFSSPVSHLHIAEGGSAQSGHDDGAVRLWGLQHGELIQSVAAHKRRVIGLASYEGGVISCGDDKQVRVWSVQAEGAGRIAPPVDVGDRERYFSFDTLRAGSKGVVGLSSGSKVEVLAWDPQRGWRLLVAFDSLSSYQMSLSLDGRLLALVSPNRKDLEIREFPFSKAGRKVEVGDNIRLGEFSADGAQLLVPLLTNTAHAWLVEVATGAVKRLNFPRKASLQHGRFLPNGDVLAPIVIGKHSEFHVISARTGKLRRTWPTLRTRSVIGSALAGKTLATAMIDGSLHLWDLAAGRPRAILVETIDQAGFAYHPLLSPDGTLLTTSRSGTGGIDVWDTRTARLRLRLQGAGGVAFDSGGRTIYRYSHELGLHAWKVSELLEDRAQLVQKVWEATGLLVLGLRAQRFEKPIELARRGARLTQRWLPK
jgi:WD40 repeat protein